MFHYLLPQSSPFLVQSWNIMQWNSKKMGKNIVYTNKMPGLSFPLYCAFLSLSRILLQSSLPLSQPFLSFSPLLLFASSIYFS